MNDDGSLASNWVRTKDGVDIWEPIAGCVVLIAGGVPWIPGDWIMLSCSVGTGVAVGGTGVCVAVGRTAVGGTAVGGTDVSVGGTDVGLAANSAFPQPMARIRTIVTVAIILYMLLTWQQRAS